MDLSIGAFSEIASLDDGEVPSTCRSNAYEFYIEIDNLSLLSRMAIRLTFLLAVSHFTTFFTCSSRNRDSGRDNL